MKKETPGSHYTLSLHGAIYSHKPVYISAGQGSSLLNMQMYIAYIIIIALFASLCTHTFEADKFSIKQFSFIYFTVSVVRRWNEYEIVID